MKEEKNNKRNKSIIIIVLITIIVILLGVDLLLTKTIQSNKNNKNNPLANTNSKETVKESSDIVAVVNSSSNTRKLYSINSQGKLSSLNNTDVLSIDGLGGRSFDIYKDTLYYIDTDYNLHIVNLVNNKEKKIDLSEDITVEDKLDLYSGKEYLLFVDSDNAYTYHLDSGKIQNINIIKPRFACEYNYYDKDKDIFYYRGYTSDFILKYDVSLNKSEQIISDDYSITPYNSSSKYLVINKDSIIYKYDYQSKKIEKVLDVSNVDIRSIITIKDNSVIYIEGNTIYEKEFSGNPVALASLDLSDKELISTYNIKSEQFSLISKWESVCSTYGSHGTCGEKIESIYMFKYDDNKLIDISNDYKNFGFSDIVLNN